MKAPRIAFSMLFALAALASADDLSPLPNPKDPPGLSYTVECQFVIVPAKVIPALVPELSDETKVVAAWARVQTMLERGEATLETSLYGAGGEGKLTVESIVETPYPVDIRPPESSRWLSLEKPKAPPAGAPEAVRLMPTAFDNMRTGPSLEMEAFLSPDARLIECNYVVHLLQLEKFVPTEIGRLPGARPIVLDTPLFAMRKKMSVTYLESGNPKLIGVHRLPGSEAKFELVVLTLQVHSPKAR